jgi:hypothetical protein
MGDVPQVVLVGRNQTIEDLVMACAKGELPFSGSDSLHYKVAMMGYRTTSLYEMVRAAEASLKEQQP